MENFDEPIDTGASPGSSAGLQITDEVKTYWVQSAKWAMFFAVLLFTIFGLISLAMLFIILSSSGIGGFIGLAFILALYAAILFFPGLYYYRFSTQLRGALRNEDGVQLDEAFLNLRRFYVYCGILTVILIALFVVFWFFFVAALARQNF